MPVINAIENLENFARDEQSTVDQRFGGVTQSVFDTADQVGLNDRITEARGQADAAVTNAEGSLKRRQRGLGLQLTAREKKSQARQIGLARAIAKEDRGESTRRGFFDRSRAAEQSGAAFEDGLFGTELAGTTQLANAEGQKRVNDANKKAAKRANRNSLIGSVVGAGIGIASLFASAEAIKDKHGAPKDLLKKLKGVRVDRWNYKGEEQRHVGPYAEEFNDAFSVGRDHHGMISVIDGLGVALGAIKELDAKISNAS